MPIIYAALISLAMIFPEIGHEAGPALVAEFEAETVGIEVSKNMTPVPGIMKKIAKCESNDTHFKANGEVLTGNYDPRDIGRYQINKGVWGVEAKKLGYDIYSEEGNEAFALYLFEKQGTRPWFKSKVCWSKEVAGW
ncbi:hypothetical protein A3B18_03115 [Candidatus Giovannonibacteria bacterium RIFCSPLOWO2_01_FULL_46_13]|uniref:Transglycosylase SLT domain-containing protein n=1 Tax=Candidatus Giovannonibacteria bacterium RIFCSPLOWO2_01_FULL_46_13 TaxID=1798352 RepID=A0A1F5X338_9BACT|nr:MAG: hypothetical protein A3B18_03115 [Candidatus Giovannonibacteria bacterium RIFCSPLOWO2_01_FULL_46_13]